MLTNRRERRASQEGEPVGELYDRLGARAWSLAIWIAKDERLASEVLVAVFSEATSDGGIHGDAGVLADVRRKALAATPAVCAPPPESGHSLAGAGEVRAAITALPEPQREVVELVALGRLNAATVAGAIDLPQAEVVEILAGAVRALRPLLRGAGSPVRRESQDVLSDLALGRETERTGR